jgi:hypothetical protein
MHSDENDWESDEDVTVSDALDRERGRASAGLR